MTIRLFLFDLDGTLVDTAPDLALAVNMVRTARGIAPLPEEELRPYASRGAPGLLGKAMGIGRDDPAFPDLRTEFLDNYAAHMTDPVPSKASPPCLRRSGPQASGRASSPTRSSTLRSGSRATSDSTDSLTSCSAATPKAAR